MTQIDVDPPPPGPRGRPLRHRGDPRPGGGGGRRPGPADEGRGIDRVIGSCWFLLARVIALIRIVVIDYPGTSSSNRITVSAALK